MKLTTVVAACVLTVAWHSASADMPSGKYLEGQGDGKKLAVILAHGRNGNSDGVVVGPLRVALNKNLGVHTLSLDMPTLATGDSDNNPNDLAPLLPDAHKSIQQAIDFLRKEKGVERIYLMGYSRGARFTTSFAVSRADADIAGFIGIGMAGGGQGLVNVNQNLRKMSIPVIDIFSNSDEYSKQSESRKDLVSTRYLQVPLSGAPHSYKNYESYYIPAVQDWLKNREAIKN